MGRRRLGNDEVLAAARANPDVLIPFGSVDPHQRQARACARPGELIEQRRARLQVPPQHPGASGPTTRSSSRSTEVIAEAGLIALFHCGHDRDRGRHAGRRRRAAEVLQPDVRSTTSPPTSPSSTSSSPTRRSPGRRRRSPSRSHKPNVYIDLSGWSPKYFPEILVQYADTHLRDKMLFGSDFPLLTPDRWIADFEKLPIRDEVRPAGAEGQRRQAAGALMLADLRWPLQRAARVHGESPAVSVRRALAHLRGARGTGRRARRGARRARRRPGGAGRVPRGQLARAPGVLAGGAGRRPGARRPQHAPGRG